MLPPYDKMRRAGGLNMTPKPRIVQENVATALIFYHRRWLISLASVVSFTPRLGHAASYAPLDCAKISTTAELTVCKSYMLGQDEARLATLFGVLTSRVAIGQRADLVDKQRRWIPVREACGSNAECLSPGLSFANKRALAGARCIGKARAILSKSTRSTTSQRQGFDCSAEPHRYTGCLSNILVNRKHSSEARHL
jgi:uncharacterized protein YecT (DUF1311 family)